VGEAILRIGTRTARGTRVRAFTVPDGAYRPGSLGTPTSNQRADAAEVGLSSEPVTTRHREQGCTCDRSGGNAFMRCSSPQVAFVAAGQHRQHQ
jgi:hypothetical protein